MTESLNASFVVSGLTGTLAVLAVPAMLGSSVVGAPTTGA